MTTSKLLDLGTHTCKFPKTTCTFRSVDAAMLSTGFLLNCWLPSTRPTGSVASNPRTMAKLPAQHIESLVWFRFAWANLLFFVFFFPFCLGQFFSVLLGPICLCFFRFAWANLLVFSRFAWTIFFPVLLGPICYPCANRGCPLQSAKVRRSAAEAGWATHVAAGRFFYHARIGFTATSMEDLLASFPWPSERPPPANQPLTVKLLAGEQTATECSFS